ncbi:putative efflux pump membrane fusion protein [Rubripirellula obstinata]|uniref:Putative efflux pump membrane fusion protein n=2 Tax=Rubripirellula obstinata TaxID=406547 RepID=A0A5B1CL24_9BACT|nr:putative efflux pump membrane fusion protein [Rubripirellula obstinata]
MLIENLETGVLALVSTPAFKTSLLSSNDTPHCFGRINMLKTRKKLPFRQKAGHFRFAGIAIVALAPIVALAADGDTVITIPEAQLSLIQNTLIAAPMAGVVDEVMVTEGDRVTPGQNMVQLNADQVTTELRAAEAASQAAQLEAGNDVDARYAARTLEVRQRELQQNIEANEGFAGAISDTEIEKLKLVVDQSQLAIEQAKHDLQVAAAAAREKSAAAEIVKARLEKHSIKAPIESQVVEIDVQPGQWVEAGKPVVRLISLDPIRAECFVDGRKHGDDLVGRQVEFTMAETVGTSPTQTLVGEVVFVSPEVHPVTGQARLWATLKNPSNKGRAGMRGALTIK